METTTITQKCKNCHGGLVFDAEKNALVCDKCGNSITVINNVTSVEESFQELLSKAPDWQKDASVYACKSCGAKGIVNKFDIVIKCDYCGAENINRSNEVPGLRPNTVVLFKLNQAEAKARRRSWLSKRFFVPNIFKRKLEQSDLSGIYYPAYTFDAQAAVRYSAVAVQTRTSTLVVNGEEISHSQTVSRPIDGVGEETFDDLLIMANEEIAPEVCKKLEPFGTQNGCGFKPEYLSGYTVGLASKDPVQAWAEVKKTIEGIVRNKIITRYSGFRLENLKLEINITNIMYKHVLLPFYVSRTQHQDKTYNLLINGETGKVYGKTPKSGWKIFRFFALGLLGVGATIFLAMFL